MTKNQLCLTSLVSAVPGLILALLMVSAFFNYAGGPTGGFKAISAGLLLIGAFLAIGIERAVGADHAGGHPGVARGAALAEAVVLYGTGTFDSGADLCRGFRWDTACDFGIAYRGDFDVNINAIK